jgi:hypothetical protein
MKISSLRKKIIINFSVTGVLVVTFGLSIFFNSYQKNSSKEKTEEIIKETMELEKKTTDLQKKTIEIKRYISLWLNLSDNKKSTNGIKMDDINATLVSVADKYSIKNPEIKVALPETLKDGLFNRSTISVSFTTANLNFRAVSDTKALLFIEELFKSIPGYQVITNLDLKKDKDYTTEDLIALSSGKSSGNVSAKVDFFWYSFKNKSPEVKAPDIKNPATKNTDDKKIPETKTTVKEDEKKSAQ